MSSANELRVRKFQKADKAQVIALWKSAFPDDPPHNSPDTVLSQKLEIDDLIFVAMKGDVVVGACIAGYDGHRGWLYAVAVQPQYRRDGVGSKLIKHTIEQLKNIGCKKINIQIRASNSEVASFYRSLGFIKEERVSMGILLDT